MTAHATRTLRDRHAAAAAELDRAAPAASDAAAALIGETTTVSSYPTSASCYYAVQPGNLGGTEGEGDSASFTSDASPVVYGWNAGTQVPPVGTLIVCHAIGGRWVFRYDG